MNRTLRALLSFIVVLAGFAVAFASGYLARGWVDPAPAAAGQPGAASRPDLGIYWEVWDLLDRDFYGPQPDVAQRTYGSVRGLVAAFADPYTYFVEPQPHQLQSDNLRGSFGGIGAWIEQDATGYFLRPMPDQPADRAGIRDGDYLLLVEETPVTLALSADAVVALVRGPVGSQVCVTVSRAGEELRFCMERAEIQVPSVEWRMLTEDAATATIGYIRHTNFSARSAQEMSQAQDELLALGADRFILDLRGNPGGLLDAAVNVASLWLDRGVILYELHADGRERTFEATPGDRAAGHPLVVIMDGASASASEILAGALQDRERAVLVGEKSFGKGSVQLVHDLSDASSLHVTTARWYTPARHAIDGAGLLPDVTVPPDSDPLAAAIDVVQELTGQE